MLSQRFAWHGNRLCVLLAVLATAGAAVPSRAGSESAVNLLDPPALAAGIDQYLAGQWESAKVKSAPVADDAEFLRRTYLDLVGRIPSVSEARAFLHDNSADKREKLIDKLLASPACVNHFTNFWRSLILPEDAGNIQFRIQTPDFEAWLRKRLRNNVPYDQIVRELLTAGNNVAMTRGIQPTPNAEPTPNAFYQFNENKAENLAAATSRLFLGVKLECAQCHDHPFAQWKREQFWGYAAFFGGLQPQRRGDDVIIVNGVPENLGNKKIKIPGTEKVVAARFLDGKEPDWQGNSNGRTILADWVTAPDNPFFARAAVNRLWGHFFGHALIEPVDDLMSDQGNSHPALLDDLAKQFAAHKFDLKYLMKSIVMSQAYQRSSQVIDAGQDDVRLFSHMAVKGLSPEQLFDSLAQATGWQDRNDNNPRGKAVIFGPGGPRDEFVSKFASTGKRTDVQTSILQALSLMNGRFMDSATSVDRSELLAAVVDFPMETPEKIETLYLAALSRKPTAKELERLTAYARNGDDKKALADVFWALLNSSEFVLNH